jgi:hypothetical protein
MISIPSLKLTVNFIKDRKQVIAYSPALDISTVGKSEKHAKKRFEELVQIFLKDIFERNVVSEVLTELGWKKISSPSHKSEWVPPQVKSIDLRIPMMA